MDPLLLPAPQLRVAPGHSVCLRSGLFASSAPLDTAVLVTGNLATQSRVYCVCFDLIVWFYLACFLWPFCSTPFFVISLRGSHVDAFMFTVQSGLWGLTHSTTGTGGFPSSVSALIAKTQPRERGPCWARRKPRGSRDALDVTRPLGGGVALSLLEQNKMLSWTAALCSLSWQHFLEQRGLLLVPLLSRAFRAALQSRGGAAGASGRALSSREPVHPHGRRSRTSDPWGLSSGPLWRVCLRPPWVTSFHDSRRDVKDVGAAGRFATYFKFSSFLFLIFCFCLILGRRVPMQLPFAWSPECLLYWLFCLNRAPRGGCGCPPGSEPCPMSSRIAQRCFHILSSRHPMSQPLTIPCTHPNSVQPTSGPLPSVWNFL